MPLPSGGDGFIPTLNQMGWMAATLDRYSAELIADAAQEPGPLLEIGAAYGNATLAALAAGASVIANDLDPRHLELLAEQAPPAQRARLTLMPGAFPGGLELEPRSVGAILIARVLHFISPEALVDGAARLARWIRPGGRLVITAETPYLRNFAAFIPAYEARKAAGDPFPGWLDDTRAVAPERAAHMPPAMHFLDPDVLRRVFGEAGFEIERCEIFARPEFPPDIRYDGRESVALVARAPR